MTQERRRAFIIVATMFIAGVLVGILATGVWHKYSGSGRRPMGWREGGKERFLQKILSIAEADSLQAKQMRPIMNEAMSRIDYLQQTTDREVRAVVDSLGLKLEPILRPEQLQKLKEFHERGRPDRNKHR